MEGGLIEALERTGATDVKIVHIPGMWAVSYRKAGKLHRHGFAGGISQARAAEILTC